jgi:hypothetical protein
LIGFFDLDYIYNILECLKRMTPDLDNNSSSGCWPCCLAYTKSCCSIRGIVVGAVVAVLCWFVLLAAVTIFNPCFLDTAGEQCMEHVIEHQHLQHQHLEVPDPSPGTVTMTPEPTEIETVTTVTVTPDSESESDPSPSCTPGPTAAATAAATAVSTGTGAFTDAWPMPPFYIYDDPVITLKAMFDKCDKENEAYTAKYKGDSEAAKQLLQALESHPMRVRNHTKAHLKIIPWRLRWVCRSGPACFNSLRRKALENARDALVAHPAFGDGSQHLIYAQYWMFSRGAFYSVGKCVDFPKLFAPLSNVIVARFEVFGNSLEFCAQHKSQCRKLPKAGGKLNTGRRVLDLTKCSIVAPYSIPQQTQILANNGSVSDSITYESWKKRKYFVHYRHSGRASANGATPLRRDIFAKGRYIPHDSLFHLQLDLDRCQNLNKALNTPDFVCCHEETAHHLICLRILLHMVVFQC